MSAAAPRTEAALGHTRVVVYAGTHVQLRERLTGAASVPKQAIMHQKALFDALWHHALPTAPKLNLLGE